ncbi:MAG: molybdate ABC transporter substrate-binding protein [Thermoleophilia bacterium]|nr:molybdate ABC transporter substrate-binding protein [Thermoleophilia bacterium]
MNRHRSTLPLLLALALGLTAACGGGSDPPAAGSHLTVLAAASLRDVMPALDPAATYSFGGSDELATQIREGAPADVYAAASPKYPQQLFDEGLVEQPVTFATNRVVVVVPVGNPAEISSVEDVARPGVKLVLGAEGVPVGDYARKALDALGLAAALRNVVSNEDDVKGVVAKVALGEADAGFVYATDVRPVAGEVEVIELPASAQPVVAYQVAVIRDSSRVEIARAFVALLLAEPGRAALRAAGFGLP